MDINSCVNCGGDKFLEENCELFCFNCGALNRVSSTQIATSQVALKGSWSLLIKDSSKNTKKISTGAKTVDKLTVLHIILKSFATTLSEYTNTPKLYNLIGELWMRYLNIRADKCQEKHDTPNKHSGLLYCKDKLSYCSLNRLLLLRLCFIAIKSIGLNFTYFDLKLLILKDILHFYKWKSMMPENVEFDKIMKKIEKYNFIQFGDQFYDTCRFLVQYLKFRDFNVLNFDLIIDRFLTELHFPEQICEITKSLKVIWISSVIKKDTRSFPFTSHYINIEIYCMSLILLAARYYFSISWDKSCQEQLKPQSALFVSFIHSQFNQWEKKITNYDDLIFDEFIRICHTRLHSSIYQHSNDILTKCCNDLVTNSCSMESQNITKTFKLNDWLNSIEHILKSTPEQEIPFFSFIDSSDHLGIDPVFINSFGKENLNSENVNKSSINFINITKPLRNIIYKIPFVLFDDTPEFIIMVERASQKLAISKKFLLEIMSDIESDLLGTKLYPTLK